MSAECFAAEYPEPAARVSPQEFFAEMQVLVQPGARLLHGQLYPFVYPVQDDQALYEALSRQQEVPPEVTQNYGPFLDFIAQARRIGAFVQRLRALPEPDGATAKGIQMQALVDMGRITAEAGENARACRLRPQLGRLATIDAAPALHEALRQSLRDNIPRGSFWAVWNKEEDGPALVAVMNYTGDVTDDAGRPTLPEVAIYRRTAGMPSHILAYAAFWRGVFDDGQHSVPLDDWQELYAA